MGTSDVDGAIVGAPALRWEPGGDSGSSAKGPGAASEYDFLHSQATKETFHDGTHAEPTAAHLRADRARRTPPWRRGDRVPPGGGGHSPRAVARRRTPG